MQLYRKTNESLFLLLLFVVVESYELTGKHTYLPMSITIGCLVVVLLALAALFKDLGPRSNQREMKAATSAIFGLGISQELIRGKIVLVYVFTIPVKILFIYFHRERKPSTMYSRW